MIGCINATKVGCNENLLWDFRTRQFRRTLKPVEETSVLIIEVVPSDVSAIHYEIPNRIDVFFFFFTGSNSV